MKTLNFYFPSTNKCKLQTSSNSDKENEYRQTLKSTMGNSQDKHQSPRPCLSLRKENSRSNEKERSQSQINPAPSSVTSVRKNLFPVFADAALKTSVSFQHNTKSDPDVDQNDFNDDPTVLEGTANDPSGTGSQGIGEQKIHQEQSSSLSLAETPFDRVHLEREFDISVLKRKKNFPAKFEAADSTIVNYCASAELASSSVPAGTSLESAVEFCHSVNNSKPQLEDAILHGIKEENCSWIESSMEEVLNKSNKMITDSLPEQRKAKLKINKYGQTSSKLKTEVKYYNLSEMDREAIGDIVKIRVIEDLTLNYPYVPVVKLSQSEIDKWSYIGAFRRKQMNDDVENK